MAIIPDALPKALADTLYAAQPAPVNAVSIETPPAVSWNDTTRQFTIPASTKFDYYEWRGISGFVPVAAGTFTRDSVHPTTTRIHIRAKTGYAVLGSNFAMHVYP